MIGQVSDGQRFNNQSGSIHEDYDAVIGRCYERATGNGGRHVNGNGNDAISDRHTLGAAPVTRHVHA